MTYALKLFFICALFTQNLLAQPLPLPEDPQQPVPPPPPRNDQLTYTLGTQEADRFQGRFTDFYPRSELSHLVSLRVTSLDNSIEIKQVRIIYDDRNEVFDSLALRGRLDRGQTRGIFLSGRPIYSIEVMAVVGSVFKKAGTYRIEATARRSHF